MKLTRSAIIGLVAVVFLHGCRNSSAEARSSVATPPANEVWISAQQIKQAGITTMDVALRPVDSALLAMGRITFSDSRLSHVFSPVTGRVASCNVSLGETVRRGTPLAVIQSPDLATAISDLQKADADLSAALRDYERQKELYQAHAAAQRDFEAAESNYRKARAEKTRAAQKSHLLLGSSQSSSQDYILRSPIDGEVIARSITPGMEVQGQYSGGTSPELFTIGNPDPAWVLADVFEVDLPRIQRGAPVDVSVVSYPGRRFPGHVEWISGALDPATHTAKVRCSVDNAEHLLRPEMFATTAIATDGRQKLTVPRSAVVRLGDQMVAFVDKGAAPGGGARYERRLIAVDEGNAGEFVEVTRGLSPGERVVSTGAIVLTGSAQ